jgi:hypothetical protein
MEVASTESEQVACDRLESTCRRIHTYAVTFWNDAVQHATRKTGEEVRDKSIVSVSSNTLREERNALTSKWVDCSNTTYSSKVLVHARDSLVVSVAHVKVNREEARINLCKLLFVREECISSPP